jgi:hypothetical protein
MLAFVANVRTAGIEAETPFAAFLESLCPILVAVSYHADQPIIESFATLCMKHVFLVNSSATNTYNTFHVVPFSRLLEAVRLPKNDRGVYYGPFLASPAL